jgi:hypothetical protein
LLTESIRSLASRCAARDSGTWTAIWSPSKSALNAVQTSGWIWMAEPSISDPERLDAEAVKRRGAVQQDQVILDHLLQDLPHSRVDPLDEPLGALMLWACPWSTSFRITNGLNSSSAIRFGSPHSSSARSGLRR